MKKLIITLFCFLTQLGWSQTGPFDPGVGEPGSLAIHRDSTIIESWATDCEVERGFENMANPMALASSGSATNALGPADGLVVSLGDSGVATFTFSTPLKNNNGFDIAIFENGFTSPGGDFLEFSFVEISSNGNDFYRFPAVSLLDTSQQVGSFDVIDPSYVHLFAGKHTATYGTPFDFEVLDSVAALDINAITHVRIIDVVGSIQDGYATRDSRGNKVNDPFPTEFPSSGFDLDALAILNSNLVSANYQTETIQQRIFPNPASEVLHLEYSVPTEVKIYAAHSTHIFYAKTVLNLETIDVSSWQRGVYFITAIQNGKMNTQKVVLY